MRKNRLKIHDGKLRLMQIQMSSPPQVGAQRDQIVSAVLFNKLRAASGS